MAILKIDCSWCNGNNNYCQGCGGKGYIIAKTGADMEDPDWAYRSSCLGCFTLGLPILAMIAIDALLKWGIGTKA